MAEEPVQVMGDEVRELTTKEKREIIKQVIEQGKDEAKYILAVTEWEGFHEVSETKVIDGKVEFVLLYKKLKGEKVWQYAVIPKTTRVILRFDIKDDWGEEHTTLYVFTPENGWKSFDLY